MNAVVATFESLEGSHLSVGLRASEWVYPMVNTLHLLGVALLVGPILILDWRILFARSSPTVLVLLAVLLPTARVGFAIAVLAGSLLFLARPLDYAFNTLFQAKLGVMAFALLNITWLHRSKAWGLMLAHGQMNPRVRLACGFSMVFWLLALTLGRLVGYR